MFWPKWGEMNIYQWIVWKKYAVLLIVILATSLIL